MAATDARGVRGIWQALALILGLSVAPAPPSLAADTVRVQISVTNIVKPGGVLLLGAYQDPGAWLGANPVARKEVPVPAGIGTGPLRFELSLPPGRYAISLFQDLNGNRTLDTNFLGIPKEASGSSRNAPARFSAPKFDDAVFTLGSEPMELAIRLN